jgi:3-deoxy-manno-octulosonate cytidylyltransferase (CMP-KDO synthetase)
VNSAVVIVPARLASTRFPEKVLAALTGKPLVQHVAEAAASARCAKSVVVAADDPRIADALRPFGTRVVLTSKSHPNGTSRLAEAARLLGLAPSDVIVNAQGDEPEMQSAAIDGAVSALVSSGRAAVGTVAAPLASLAEHADPNVVKVVRDQTGHALYFSRATIPLWRDAPKPGSAATPPLAQPSPAPPLRHIGVYAYRRDFLERYTALPPTPLEQTEQLEQLRALEHGHAIAVATIQAAHPGIDTPEQYQAFVERWKRTHP